MSNIFIFILVFNGLCFAQNFDNYKTSDQQTIRFLFKRSHADIKKPDGLHVIKDKAESGDSNNAKPVEEKENAVETIANTQSTDTHKAGAKNEGINESEKHETKNNDSAGSEVHDGGGKVTTEKKALNNSIVENSEGHNIPPHNGTGKAPPDHQGALRRALYLFVGISSLLLLYLMFKSFRLRPGAPAPSTVRKYGVVGRRNDMEMLPLPLAEEDDDDTLFEVSPHSNR